MSKITLEFPIQHAGALVSEIELRRPKAGDMLRLDGAMKARGLAVDEDQTASSIVLLSMLSNLPEAAIEDLDIADFNALNEGLTDFLQSRGSSKGKPRK